MTIQSTSILLQRNASLARIKFNRPETLNAINPEMAEAFLSAVQGISHDKEIRAVLLSGEGRGFMAGGDLSVLGASPVAGAKSLIDPLHQALAILSTMDAPVVAYVHGVVAGAGVSLMLQADYVVAAEGTRFNLAYANIGTSCDAGASWTLPRFVGMRRALEIALLSEPFDAEAAKHWGLINRVEPKGAAEAAAVDVASRMAVGPTVALGRLRRLIRSSFDKDLTHQLDAESAAFLECAATADFKLGVEAFRAKQLPNFQGR